MCPRPDSNNWPAVEERLFYPLGSWTEDGGHSPEPVCMRGRIAFRPASIADNSASLIALSNDIGSSKSSSTISGYKAALFEEDAK